MTPFPEAEQNIPAGAREKSAPEPQPAPQFRNDLQRALEQTHRQQSARRALGAHVSDYEQQLATQQRRQRQMFALLAALVALLAWLWWRSWAADA